MSHRVISSNETSISGQKNISSIQDSHLILKEGMKESTYGACLGLILMFNFYDVFDNFFSQQHRLVELFEVGRATKVNIRRCRNTWTMRNPENIISQIRLRFEFLTIRISLPLKTLLIIMTFCCTILTNKILVSLVEWLSFTCNIVGIQIINRGGQMVIRDTSFVFLLYENNTRFIYIGNMFSYNQVWLHSRVRLI